MIALTCSASVRATMWTWSLSSPMGSTQRRQNCSTLNPSSLIPCSVHMLQLAASTAVSCSIPFAKEHCCAASQSAVHDCHLTQLTIRYALFAPM